MGRAGLCIGLALALVVAGCLGAGEQGAADRDREAETVEPNTSAMSVDRSSTEVNTSADGCAGVRENVTALLAARDEDPFGDREPLAPQLQACGEEGLFLLAAHGLEGARAIELTWRFPAETACRVLTATAAGGGHHRFHVGGWDRPDGETSVGAGFGGGSPDAYVGPADAQDVVADGAGHTAWGGTSNASMAAGEHSYVATTNGWSPWDNPLTEGAALLVILVCEESFSFEGTEAASIHRLFSHHDLEQGAGADPTFLAGASAGLAVVEQLDKPARLRVGGFAREGLGAVRIADADGEDEHVFGPEAPLDLVEDLPEGALRISAARGGAVSLAGVVYGGMVPIATEEIVG